jgi:hypothetical protein
MNYSHLDDRLPINSTAAKEEALEVLRSHGIHHSLLLGSFSKYPKANLVFDKQGFNESVRCLEEHLRMWGVDGDGKYWHSNNEVEETLGQILSYKLLHVPTLERARRRAREVKGGNGSKITIAPFDVNDEHNLLFGSKNHQAWFAYQQDGKRVGGCASCTRFPRAAIDNMVLSAPDRLRSPMVALAVEYSSGKPGANYKRQGKYTS